MRVNAIACLGFVCALPLAAQENLGIYQNTATAFEHGDAGRSHTLGEAIFAEDMSETADYSVEVREAITNTSLPVKPFREFGVSSR